MKEDSLDVINKRKHFEISILVRSASYRMAENSIDDLFLKDIRNWMGRIVMTCLKKVNLRLLSAKRWRYFERSCNAAICWTERRSRDCAQSGLGRDSGINSGTSFLFMSEIDGQGLSLAGSDPPMSMINGVPGSMKMTSTPVAVIKVFRFEDDSLAERMFTRNRRRQRCFILKRRPFQNSVQQKWLRRGMMSVIIRNLVAYRQTLRRIAIRQNIVTV